MSTQTVSRIGEINLVIVASTDQDRPIKFYDALGFENETVLGLKLEVCGWSRSWNERGRVTRWPCREVLARRCPWVRQLRCVGRA
jgi:hypothetical protein